MDDIQRKLALIEKQFSTIPSHEYIFGNCPLLFTASGLISGILVQHYFNFPINFWFWLLFSSSTAIILLFVFKRNFTNSRHVSAYLALICFLCLGSIRLTSYLKAESNDIRNVVSDEPVLATIRGYITTEPHTNKFTDWEFAQFMPSDPGSSFYMEMSEIETNSGWAKTTGTIRANVYEMVLDLSLGDYIQAYCWLDSFKQPTNPGQFNTADYLARNRVFVGASIKSRSGIKIIQKPDAGTFTFIKNRVRELAKVALLGDLPTDNDSSGLLQALLLGYRGNIDSETSEAFRKTGLSHFISLSGLHMGIIIGLIWWFSKITGFMKPGRSIICIIAIITFLMVIPPKAPSIRASIIAFMFCLSFLFRRHTNSINTLSLAAIILLLVRPTQLFEAGWQLSFTSVLGIILFSKRINFFLHEKFDDLITSKSLNQGRIFYSIKSTANNAINLFSVGFSAWIASAGILLYHFYTVTPLASFWTVLVFPFVSAILILGFLKILLFFVLPTLSALLGILVSYLSVFLIDIVKIIARLNISEILIGHVPLVVIVLLYCAMGVFILTFYSYPSLRQKLVFAAIPAIIIVPGTLKWQNAHNENLVLTCLDVGHGQSIFLQTPDGTNILFDAGSMYISNIGKRIVIPFLNYSGIRKIDSVMISHNDIDHINGIPEIVKNCKVGNIYANDDFFSHTDEWGTSSFLNECLKQSGYKVKSLEEETIFDNKANIKILWPTKESNYQKDLSENDKSLVTSIEFAGKNILLCSDIEQFAQKEVMRLYPDLKADIVIVPHHGSTNTLEPDFLKSLNPDILICSTDKTPSFQNSGQLFYTSRDGAITISINKQGKINLCKTLNSNI